MELIKKTAFAAAFRSGKILSSYLGKIREPEKKGKIDLVTEADIQSERAIIDLIRSEFPDHGIIAEESGSQKKDRDVVWIIDPLDGTTNFAHQLGLFSVSIACAFQGKLVLGIVFCPVTNELFSAEAGKGAYLNNEPIRVSKTGSVSESLLVTGFPYNLPDIFDVLMERFGSCLKAAQGIRRLGSAALDLCHVACGRFDGFWEQNLKPWDTAAGSLIAREAGAVITDFGNTEFSIDKQEILATNGRIHDEMLSILEVKTE